MTWRAGRNLPTDWRARRLAVLERDRWRCRQCGRHAPGNPQRSPMDRRGILEVDHVGDRDNHALENLRTLCYRCHGKRTADQGNAARASTLRRAENHPGILR